MMNRRFTGGAAPRNKATPGDNKGAQLPTTQPKPASPPTSPSGVSPSRAGSR